MQAQQAADSKKFDVARDCLAKATSEAEKSEDEYSKLHVFKEQVAVAMAEERFVDAERYSLLFLSAYDGMIAHETNHLQKSQLIEDRGRAGVLLGDSLEAQKRHEDALKAYKNAEKLVAEAGGDMSLQGVLGGRISELSEKTNHVDESVTVEARLTGSNDSRVDRRQAHMYLKKGDLNRAAEFYKSAQIACSKTKDRHWYFENTLELGKIHFLLGEQDETKKDVELIKSGLTDDVNGADLIQARNLALSALVDSAPSEEYKSLEPARAISALKFLEDAERYVKKPEQLAKIEAAHKALNDRIQIAIQKAQRASAATKSQR